MDSLIGETLQVKTVSLNLLARKRRRHQILCRDHRIEPPDLPIQPIWAKQSIQSYWKHSSKKKVVALKFIKVIAKIHPTMTSVNADAIGRRTITFYDGNVFEVGYPQAYIEGILNGDRIFYCTNEFSIHAK